MATNKNTQGDPLLYQTVDDGEINVNNGIVEMSGGLGNAAYLALFGGNEEDSGQSGTERLQWWGNYAADREENKYRSETQNLLESLPITSGNLLKVNEAAKRDLNFFVTNGIAESVEIASSIPGLNKIKITIDITTSDNNTETFVFIENWRARK